MTPLQESIYRHWHNLTDFQKNALLDYEAETDNLEREIEPVGIVRHEEGKLSITGDETATDVRLRRELITDIIEKLSRGEFEEVAILILEDILEKEANL